eukprot:gnl/TRDRNA2_/TRDRNA2_46560_c0_seq1.p1 gnl/TRDRNA2_/TRDRNA2_46560_c0~~gnl/TRDRNA2_/TRDRNA2_46560_c0_seq1.p1  ORF type:complete len:232 (-),score=29.59 gnl/TRDRNA2_/TRDRNA2_46560_c0_seq1:87-731(-)
MPGGPTSTTADGAASMQPLCFSQASLDRLRKASTESEQAAASASCRALIQQDLETLARLLNDLEARITPRGLQPSEPPPAAMAEAEHQNCAYKLSMVLDRFEELQLAAKDLEAHDSSSRQNGETSNEYAMLGVDIVSQQDRALQLFRLLCDANDVYSRPQAGLLSQIFNSLFVCGSSRHVGCARCWRHSEGIHKDSLGPSPRLHGSHLGSAVTS